MRPFYVLLLGRYGDVAHYFEQLKKLALKDLIKDEQFIIFGQNLVQEATLLSVEPNSSKLLKGMRRLTTTWVKGNSGNTRIRVGNRPIEILEVTNPANSTNSFTYQGLYSKSPYALQINSDEPNQGNAFILDVNMGTFDNRKKAFTFTQQSEGLSTQQSLLLIEWNVESPKMTLTTQVNPEPLDAGTYFFQVDLIPQNFSDQEWWQQLNSTGNQRDGSKTDNLLLFLRSLKVATTEVISRTRLKG